MLLLLSGRNILDTELLISSMQFTNLLMDLRSERCVAVCHQHTNDILSFPNMQIEALIPAFGTIHQNLQWNCQELCCIVGDVGTGF